MVPAVTHYAMVAGRIARAWILAPLPVHGACGLAETARAVRYLAAQNAGQCGPCLNGLPAIAGAMERVAFRGAHEPALGRWLSVVPGRGGLQPP